MSVRSRRRVSDFSRISVRSVYEVFRHGVETHVKPGNAETGSAQPARLVVDCACKGSRNRSPERELPFQCRRSRKGCQVRGVSGIVIGSRNDQAGIAAQVVKGRDRRIAGAHERTRARRRLRPQIEAAAPGCRKFETTVQAGRADRRHLPQVGPEGNGGERFDEIPAERGSPPPAGQRILNRKGPPTGCAVDSRAISGLLDLPVH